MIQKIELLFCLSWKVIQSVKRSVKSCSNVIIMSSRRMNQKSMFCKVCKDAGLCEKMFTSHNVKDIRGQVCCPTLRNNVCSRCNCRGHTPSYCPGSKQQAVMVRIVKHAAVPSKKAPAAAVPSNTFASLDEDSDEEDEVCDLKPHPNVTVRPVCMLRVSKRCWADMEDDDEE